MFKMSYKTKKIISSIVWIVVLLAIVFCIFFVVKNKDALWNKVENNTTIFTQEQLDQEKDKAYNQGYIDAHTNNVELNKRIEQYLETIADRNNTIAEKEATIENNNKTIEAKNKTITEKQAEIEKLKTDFAGINNNYTERINDLEIQIASLQLQNQTLQNDNATNLATIIELNNEKAELETRVSELSAEIERNNTLIKEYEANKEAWLNSIKYYESFINALETDTQAVAIFEVNNAVYKAQIVTKGTTAKVTNPADTETTFFIGWYVNDELVDINTQPITTNTIFVAKFDTAYSVNFMLDNDNEFTTVKVAKDNYVTELETLPTKAGYAFDGFTLNSVDIVDYTTYPITQNTTFIAKFTKLHTVTFIVKDEVVATQQVRNGELAQELEGYDKGWLVNNEKIILDNYPICANTVLVYNTTLSGLTQVNNSYAPTNLWHYNFNTYYSYGSNHKKLNTETGEWETITWNGLDNFYASYIWSVKGRVFYSMNKQQYELNKGTNTWEPITWTGETTNPGAIYIYVAGDNAYYGNGSNRYKLNIETFTVEIKDTGISISSKNVWSDGTDTYYSDGSRQYKFNSETEKWEEHTWSGLTEFYGKYVWKGVDNNTYYSNGSLQFRLDKKTNTWVEKTWEGLSEFDGDKIWTDYKDTYCSYNNSTYKFYV